MMTRPYANKFIVAGLAVAIGVALFPMFARASDGVPALEIVSPSGVHSILLGSMHVADPKLRQPDPSVLNGVRQLVLEHEGTPAPASAAPSSVGTPSWSALLSPNQIAQLRSHLQCQYPSSTASDIGLWLQLYLRQPTPTDANQLAYATCDSVGYRSRDAIITAAAHDRQLPKRYLETDQEIRRLRLQLPADNVSKSFEVAFSPKAAQLKARVVAALNRGDYADVAAASAESQALAGDDPKQINAIMVRHRDAEWMKTLPGLLDSGATFVLVGASHLLGPDGLIARLRARGFVVRPIELPAGSGR
ncbi:hypothetical protein WK54_20015 [Burkholderia ubonensis]|nr:hypothetical protein WK54_20015 [Burkholderia ubonensis]